MPQKLKSIFYADDDLDDLDFFKEVTEDIQAPISLFEDGQQLLNALDYATPETSLIFLDLNMPVMSGFDVLKEIKDNPRTEGIPVVILTTSINPDDIKLSKKLGANLYIRKPVSINALKKAIQYALSIDWKSFIPNDVNFIYR